MEGRFSGNIACLLATAAFLFGAVALSDGGFAKSIDRITKNLDVALQDLVDDLPEYSNYTDTSVYVSGASFYPVGMTGFYNLTEKFMDALLPKDFLIEGLITVNDGSIQVTQTEVTTVLKTYWGLLFVIVLLILLAVLVPTCGLFFCCCRCCGNCGARSQPCDKKRDLCKKIFQGTLLIVLGTALLFCVVCAFASNQQLQDGIDSLPRNMQNGKRDANMYLESTKRQASHLLVTNFQEFSKVFNETMDKSSAYVMEQLNIWSNATAMMDLCTFVNNMPAINKSLITLRNDTNTLRASASQLNDAMRKVKKDLLNTLQTCDVLACVEIRNNISQLQTNIDFNKLPDVTPTINKLNDFDLQGLERAAKEGQNTLDSIETDISNNLASTLKQAKQKVNEAGTTIKENLNNITKVITGIQSRINDTADPLIRDMRSYVTNYGQYRYYGGLAISCVLLLVTICIALGLVCGICGKRPDRYNDNCCNKGAGSQFLICAVMIMFIFGIVLAVVATVMFVAGISTDRVVCYPIRNPEESKIMDLIDDYLHQTQNAEVSIQESLVRCYRNESIYNVLNLKTQFDVDSISQRFDISGFLDDMNSLLDGIFDRSFTILSDKNLAKLEELKTFDPSINFDQFQYELKQNFTNLSLDDITRKLEILVVELDNKPEFYDVIREVQLSILHINMYDEKLLIPMKEMANKVIDIAKQLDADLKMNSTSFPEAISDMLTEIQEAQKLLQENGTEILQKVAKEFGNMVINQVDSYLDRVTYVVKEEFGQCGPLNVAINSTLTATCDKIIIPWNGYWVSLLFSLVLFVPTIIVSVKLASLYQKFKQFGGQYVETRGGKRGKKKGKKSKYYEDRPQNLGSEAVAREHATGSHPPDTRYSDMAPKFDTADKTHTAHFY